LEIVVEELHEVEAEEEAQLEGLQRAMKLLEMMRCGVPIKMLLALG
jgi:hypothetical protein